MKTATMFRIPELAEDFFEIRVPASIANLGAAFDSLAVAVQLYLRLRVKRLPGHGRLEFRAGESDASIEQHIERGFRLLAEESAEWPSLLVDVRSEIPNRAGLGENAAALVAGFRLYEAVAGPLPIKTMVNAAWSVESDFANVAASLLGGLSLGCRLSDGSGHASSFVWPDSLSFVVATPGIPSTSEELRTALPECLPRADAVFNLQRVALLLHSLETGDFSLLKHALHDRVHQPVLQKVIPGLKRAFELQHEDLLGICLSGLGPSIVAIAEDNLSEVSKLLASVYDPLEIPCQIRILRIHQNVCNHPPAVFRSGLLCS